MLISIAERFRPFVHVSGEKCLLPLSKLSFKIHPAYIQVFDLSGAEPQSIAEFAVDVEGPVSEFTVLQDLEAGCLKVWGHAKNGFFRYRIHASQSALGFSCVLEKVPQGKGLTFIPASYCGGEVFEMPAIANLSFGVTKAPDWTLVKRRLILAEILPFWFRLGRLTPSLPEHGMGTASLLEPAEKALLKRDSLELAHSFRNAYLAGFEGLLSCRLQDNDHQGFELPAVPKGSHCSPLVLLTKGVRLIQQMLIAINSPADIAILPCVFPELHAGRLCNVMFDGIGKIDLEWSKKKARRMIFYSAKEQAICFHFQNELKSFRLRRDRSNLSSTKICGESLFFAANTTYFFDHFQK